MFLYTYPISYIISLSLTLFASFLQMLNDKHAMVRVGGGWETLGTYLLKHDPCRAALLKTCKPNSKSPRTKEPSRDSYLVVGTHSRLKKQMSQPWTVQSVYTINQLTCLLLLSLLYCSGREADSPGGLKVKSALV